MARDFDPPFTPDEERVALELVPTFQKWADGYGRDETDIDGKGELWISPVELARLLIQAGIADQK